jgi:hypothetical protein
MYLVIQYADKQSILLPKRKKSTHNPRHIYIYVAPVTLLKIRDQNILKFCQKLFSFFKLKKKNTFTGMYMYKWIVHTFMAN